MKEKTKDLINRVLGEEAVEHTVSRVTRELGKKFTTGKDILKECEEYEHLIEREGEEAFMARVRGIVAARGNTEGVREEPAGDNITSRPPA